MNMMRGWLGIGCLTLFASLGTGCGGGDKAPPTEAQFCDQKAQKECVVTTKCGTTTSACVAQRTTKCLAVVAASKTPPRIFRPENVAKCVNRTAAVYGKTIILPTDIAGMDDDCAYVFQGDSEAACTVNYDCKGTKICDKGRCATKVPKAKDALCANPGEICNPGSHCAVDTGTTLLTCLAKKAQGEICDAAAPCVETLRCDGPTGMCAPLRMPNETCASSDDCPSPAAPYCDPYVGNKCDIGLSFAPTAVAACADYGGTGAGTGTGGGSGSDAATGTGGASGNDAAVDVPPAG